MRALQIALEVQATSGKKLEDFKKAIVDHAACKVRAFVYFQIQRSHSNIGINMLLFARARTQYLMHVRL